MTGSAASSHVTTGHVSRWKWFLALGVVLTALGVAGIGIANFMELTSVVVFGPILLAAAVIQLFVAFLEKKGTGRVLHFIASGIEAALGFWIMVHPLEKIGDLVVLLVIFFLVIGLIRACQSLAARSHDRIWKLLPAAIALALGVCVLLRWPNSRWWFLGLCIALDLLCRGIIWSGLALVEGRRGTTV